MTSPYLWTPTFKHRPLSWSQLSCFEWNKEDWYKRYVLFEKAPMSQEMEFGILVDRKIQQDKKFLPEIVRGTHLQHKLNPKFGKLYLLGFIDSYEPPFYKGTHTRAGEVRDYKTGKKAWTQERADETGQLTYYAFLLWLENKIPPKDLRFFIDWIPTQENGDFSISRLRGSKVQTFETARTMKDLLQFGQRIHTTVKEMEEYKALRDTEMLSTSGKFAV